MISRSKCHVANCSCHEFKPINSERHYMWCDYTNEGGVCMASRGEHPFEDIRCVGRWFPLFSSSGNGNLEVVESLSTELEGKAGQLQPDCQQSPPNGHSKIGWRYDSDNVINTEMYRGGLLKAARLICPFCRDGDKLELLERWHFHVCRDGNKRTCLSQEIHYYIKFEMTDEG